MSKHKPQNPAVFQTYKRFYTVESAVDFTEVLKSKNIEFHLEENLKIMDDTFTGTGMVHKAVVKIDPKDFHRANKLIEADILKSDPADYKEHYLFEFKNEELKDVIEKTDEWSVEDQAIARMLLKERGFEISEEEIEQLRLKKLEEVRRGKKGSKFYMAIYFLFIVLAFFPVPGLGVVNLVLLLGGAGMGYYYAFGRSTDREGKRYYTYNPSTRATGKYLLGFGLLAILALVVILMIFGTSVSYSSL